MVHYYNGGSGVPLLLFLFVSGVGSALVAGAASPQAPAMFVFGDSLVDSGNNNFLRTLAKANFYPYGVDFAGGATGRFSNGKTVVDAICDLLNLAYPPAYTTPGLAGAGLLGGANYASAGGGILDESGRFLGERYSLEQQVLNFEDNLDEMRKTMQGDDMAEYLAKSIVMMVIGSNDYINNYLRPPLYSSSFRYTPEQFADLLLNHYTRQILALRSLGLRKFVLASLGPLGCIPNQRVLGLALPGRCDDRANRAVGFFNRGLLALVEQLNAGDRSDGAIFVFGNVYDAIQDVLDNPGTHGFEVVDRACCGVGRNAGVVSCLPLSAPCSRRRGHVFWDAFHPTEAVNLVLAGKAYAGAAQDMYPVNLKRLVLL
ncbi:hypothetical protein ACP70R_003733 [Stipagrostis hirtigluma subsp. patula]